MISELIGLCFSISINSFEEAPDFSLEALDSISSSEEMSTNGVEVFLMASEK